MTQEEKAEQKCLPMDSVEKEKLNLSFSCCLDSCKQLYLEQLSFVSFF